MLTQSHLYREIYEQPQSLARLLEAEKATVAKLAAAIRERNISQIVIAARGTSDNAARYAQYLLGSLNGILVTLATPSLFSIYQRPPVLGNVCVLGISQSGKSPDIVAVLTEARKQGALTAAITNKTDSPLAQAGDFVIDLHAGEELAVAATKSYTAQLAAIALLSTALADDPAMNQALERLPRVVGDTLSNLPDMANVVQRYRYMQQCVVIGRGYNYSTAFELALKLKELTYTIVQPYSSADFLHGPVAVLEPGFPVIVIAPSGQMLPEMQSFIQTIRERGAEILAISDDHDTLRLSRTALRTPTGLPEWLSPIINIVPGQLLALHLAHTRDFDVDQPRGLRKVTETR